MTREELRQELLADSQTYCCYCGEAKVRFSCCGENHFETFAEMNKETQESILSDMSDEVNDFWKDYEPEPVKPAPVTKDEALKLALEALEGMDILFSPLSRDCTQHNAVDRTRKAITAIKQALAASVQKGAIGVEYQKSPWDEKGISMPPPAAPVQEPVAWHDKIIGMEVSMDVSTGDDDIDHRVYGQVYEVMLAYDGGPDVILAIESERNFTTPPAAPNLQAELDATNRQVEILSDALAESRREILAEREACAKVCDDMGPCGFTGESCAEAIRARGNT
jgi:hypothetical protein